MSDAGSAWERHQEREDGYEDVPCEVCGHMQRDFTDGCDSCGEAATDPDWDFDELRADNEREEN